MNRSANHLPVDQWSWVDRAGTWFRHAHDVLGRVYAVCMTVRVAMAVHAIVLNLVVVWPVANNRVLLLLVCLVIAVWTVLVSLWLRDPRRRTAPVFVADLLVTVAVVVSTPLVADGVDVPMTLAAYWGGGSAVYAAILLSTRWGMVEAAVVSLAYFAVPPFLLARRIDMVVLILATAFCLGALISQFRTTLEEQERQRMRSAALTERERLARIIHDGVLQVLALVEREGPLLGPRGMRLAALAKESELQLRTLLRDRKFGDDSSGTLIDLASALDKYQSARVTVSTMAGEVMVPRSVVDEVEATLVEVLNNVDRHAGPDAAVWLLLDQETDDEVILWVRDNGIGMAPETVLEASERGRLGIRDSIVGRMSALRGSAMLKSSPGLGTEWELRFPVDRGE
ncbi:MAG: sensor histidine kinase [Arachnia sp.]